MKRYSDWLMFAATLDTNILVSNYSISSPVSAILSYSASYLLFLSLVQYVSFMSKECVQQACSFSPFCLGMCEWTDCPGKGVNITPQLKTAHYVIVSYKKGDPPTYRTFQVR